jgi:Methyltransferase domain
VSAQEFEHDAAKIADAIAGLAAADRVAAACRGSANPAALAWLAEGLGVEPTWLVADLGAGLGGPAWWMSARYGCRVLAVEPAYASASAAVSLFTLPMVVGAANAAPLGSSSVDAVLLLGVLSVVDDAFAALREAYRIAPRLGLLDYCSTDERCRPVGGSIFRSPADMTALAQAAGWRIVDTSPVSIDAPQAWRDAADVVDVAPSASEAAVVAAIENGSLAPFMMVARR